MSDIENMASWFVVRTHAHAEAKAALNLERQGFATYVPRYLKRRSHARRAQIVPVPLFPRYLFVSVNMAAQRWRSIQSTFGVAQLVSSGEAPSAVSAAIVEELRNREDADGFIRLARRADFRRGETVRVIDGVFSTRLGLFECMSEKERVTLLLDLLGQKVRVVMDIDAVAAA
jgi:transcriptional antiterminator RfaH